ncbi:hypothetical protein KK060_03210 [Fulvivirgaceae bacterium PWU20]|uniref:Uncharacterized protein n=2 Tax=Chryseosolibacter indicus TaxID=2782351 RepID=A0ABS5VLE0_9BACT|nr:hypothetical protein [Chryseosolibacter indicus]
MLFVNPIEVKHRITYKEITMAIGIVVAVVVVMLTLWIKLPQPESATAPNKPTLLKSAVSKVVIHSASELISLKKFPFNL